MAHAQRIVVVAEGLIEEATLSYDFTHVSGI